MSIEKDRKHLLNNQVMRFDNNRNSSLSKTRRRAVIYVNLGNKAFLIMTIIISSFMCKREMRKSPSIGRSLFKIYSVSLANFQVHSRSAVTMFRYHNVTLLLVFFFSFILSTVNKINLKQSLNSFCSIGELNRSFNTSIRKVNMTRYVDQQYIDVIDRL